MYLFLANNGTMEVYLNSSGGSATRCRLNHINSPYVSGLRTSPQARWRHGSPHHHHPSTSTPSRRHLMADIRRKRFREGRSLYDNVLYLRYYIDIAYIVFNIIPGNHLIRVSIEKCPSDRPLLNPHGVHILSVAQIKKSRVLVILP